MLAAETGIRAQLVPLWRMIRHLFPVYAAIADCFQLAKPPYGGLSQIDPADEDCLLRIAAWIEEVDASTQPHHLRTVLQELGIGSSDLCLQMWLQHFLSKPVKNSGDRDKIDFLLVHYLRLNLPPTLQEGRISRAAIAEVLEPFLGAHCDQMPPASNELSELIGITEQCKCLADIERSGIISRGRELKSKAGDLYFTPPYLLAFTHFNTVVRRECQRLMNSDLTFIGEALGRLEKQGITHVDCTAANWSDQEPLSSLKDKWATWELQTGDYSRDFFATLIGFRAAIENALSRTMELSMSFLAQELHAIHSMLAEMQAELNKLPRRIAAVGTNAETEAEQGSAAVKSGTDPIANSAPVQAVETTDTQRVATPANVSSTPGVASEPASPAGIPDLDDGIARFKKIFSGKPPKAVSIAVSGTRVLLTGAEVAMFSDNENATARTVQRAVMSRIFLVSALEAYGKSHDKSKLAQVFAIASAEQEALRAAVATCKASKLLREEEILAATGKQLSAMVERAERILR